MAQFLLALGHAIQRGQSIQPDHVMLCIEPTTSSATVADAIVEIDWVSHQVIAELAA